MPEYRRVRVCGATVFITFVTFGRFHIFEDENVLHILYRVWNKVANRHPFTTDAICVLPDHIHTLITLPENDSNYSLRIREIKRLFTINYLADFNEIVRRDSSRISKNEATIWQRRFWEHTIRDNQDYENHFNYIHFNPVKHGLVNNVADWPWSSFHRHVKSGVYEPDWGNGEIFNNDHNHYGE